MFKSIRFPLFSLLFVTSVFSQESPIHYDFSKSTVAENGITVMGPGFGSLPLADTAFGSIPTDNAFSGATDGKGMIIQAAPGEGVMILTTSLPIKSCALIRCSIRASGSHNSIYLATIDQGQNAFVSTITPNNGSFFAGRYNRIANVFMPPSAGFQVLVQIVNTSQTKPLTVYIDNLEILSSSTNRLDFDMSEIVADSVQPTFTPSPKPSDTPIPIIPTLTPEKADFFHTITIPLPDLPAGSKPLEMVLIPNGTFTMGSPSSEKHRVEWEIQHKVTISNPFYIGKHEVTQSQWQAVMGNNPSNYRGNNLPVEFVNWDGCQTFIQKLNQLGQGTFRLPTEAEWEYACRAGTSTRFYWGEDLDYSQIGQYAWYDGNSSFYPHDVGLKLPNVWGLYDMNGNVFEWCQDWFGAYPSTEQTDPIGPITSNQKVYRGGCWNYDDSVCRSAFRGNGGPTFEGDIIGLRLVRNQ